VSYSIAFVLNTDDTLTTPLRQRIAYAVKAAAFPPDGGCGSVAAIRRGEGSVLPAADALETDGRYPRALGLVCVQPLIRLADAADDGVVHASPVSPCRIRSPGLLLCSPR